MASTQLNMSLDPQMKAAAEAVFNHIGLSLTDAIRMFLRQAIAQQGLPLRTSAAELAFDRFPSIHLNEKQSKQFAVMLESDQFDEPFKKLMAYYDNFPNLKR